MFCVVLTLHGDGYSWNMRSVFIHVDDRFLICFSRSLRHAVNHKTVYNIVFQFCYVNPTLSNVVMQNYHHNKNIFLNHHTSLNSCHLSISSTFPPDWSTGETADDKTHPERRWAGLHQASSLLVHVCYILVSLSWSRSRLVIGGQSNTLYHDERKVFLIPREDCFALRLKSLKSVPCRFHNFILV